MCKRIGFVVNFCISVGEATNNKEINQEENDFPDL